MKKILIFAHYYYPDVASTGQLLKDQAEGMCDDFVVTVICVVPSYGGNIEEKYKSKKYHFEVINGVRIIRVLVPEFSKNSKISRMKNILAYFFRALNACRKSGKQDYIFSISQPPILGGLLGVLGKCIKHAKYIYCIQDFNPEQIDAVGYVKNKLVLNMAMSLDKFSCKHSDLIITVGRDLVETLKKRFHNKRVPANMMINNWIDEKSIYPLESSDVNVVKFKEKYGLCGKYIFMYSGNIGLYYDLLNILKVINTIPESIRTETGKEVAFVFVGEGSVLKELKKYVQENEMKNVYFIPYQEKEQLIYSLNAADVHWCVNDKGIKGVSCPSKFYGIAAVAKPVLGVLEKGSEIELIIDEVGCGLVCEPGDYETIKENILWFICNSNKEEVLSMGKRGYEYSIKNLIKDVSIKKYIEAIKEL